MNYRFVKITSYYQNFQKHYYAQNTNIVFKSYNEQLKDILSKGFGWANFFQIHLNNLGNDASEIIYNCFPLQNTWAKENGITKKGNELIVEQLKILKPDVVFFQDSINFHYSFIKNLKSAVPSIKKIIGWCCSPFTNDALQTFKQFDFVFACCPQFINIFKKENIKCYELNHAFESTIHSKLFLNNNYPETDFIFIGSFIPSSDFHDYRRQLIENLLKSNVDVSIYSNLPNEKKIAAQKIGFLISSFLKKIGLKELAYSLPLIKKTSRLTESPQKLILSDKFKKNTITTPLFGIEMLKALSKSKISFNSHGGVSGEYAANIRLFETTGAGACLLTDYKKNISQFFEPDKEIVTYNSIDECIEKAKWLLNNPNDRKQIANAGQAKTLSEHTFQKRAIQLNEIILFELQII